MNARAAAILCGLTAMACGGLPAHGQASDPPPDPPRIMDVTADPPKGTSIERNGVRWTELYDASGYTDKCGTAEYTDWCLPGRLLVRNETATPLVCHGEIRMPPGNKLSLPGASRDMIVMGFSSVALVKAMSSVNINEESYSSDCRPWQPPPPPKLKAGCAYKVNAGAIQLDYPPGAKERQEEGPVVLQFTLADRSGRPRDIEVVGSSLFPELDAATVRTVAATEMTTGCPGARFTVMARYELDPASGPGPALRGLPPQKSAKGEPCKVEVPYAANPDDYYPIESLRRQEQGAVILRVIADGKARPPLDVKIESSSGFPALDMAGARAIADSRFSTNCPGFALRLKVKFALR
jgi:TonB family protein